MLSPLAEMAKNIPTVSVRVPSNITKTYLYNFDPLKPHFYIVKLVYRGIHYFFLFLLKNIDFGYSLEPPRRGGSNEYPHNLCFEQNYEKYQTFSLIFFLVFWW